MDSAIRVTTPGGPDVMRIEPIEIGDPGPGQLRIKHLIIPVNNIDIQHRSGNYPISLPSGLGVEVVGEVESVGEGVTDFDVGTRVAYISPVPGTYATAGLRNAHQVVRLPPDLPTEQVGAIFMRGILAWHLTHTVYRITAGDTVVVYAAAGGVGSLVVRLAASVGARVVGVVGSPGKAEVARAAGCCEVFATDDSDLPNRIRAALGEGASVVYDSIGKETFVRSLESLKAHGTLVAYGNDSGVVESFAPWRDLGQRGSLRLVWPMVKDFLTPDLMGAAVPAVLEAIRAGVLRIDIGCRRSLARAADAHRLVEERQTIGATILIPD
ncbi:zinc-binding dehydrogenase [Nocardia salmonicida]|uniref:zinc-binding dehydrogenase n=1 Tax=Nocardia salmonicida TaxID=53431 RepID=UPI0007A5022C|nr:zinc-binding dehydrogenase [Nocardia salmonicida]